mgnify:CR=1 FL=1
MLDIETRLTTLKRPALLARAARFGVDDYRRDVHLPRLLDIETPPRSAAALMALFSAEAEMEAARKNKAAAYRPARHVALLIAIMGEAQILRATTRAPS